MFFPRLFLRLCLLALICVFVAPGIVCGAEMLHPRNKLLVDMGLMPYPKYYPSVPRLTASQALMLFRSGKARIAWIGDDGRKVIGAGHFRENEIGAIPRAIRLAKGQVLLLYCA